MKGSMMPPRSATPGGAPAVSREQLVDLLNEDRAREYQAIIAYVTRPQERA